MPFARFRGSACREFGVFTPLTPQQCTLPLRCAPPARFNTFRARRVSVLPDGQLLKEDIELFPDGILLRLALDGVVRRVEYRCLGEIAR